MNYQWYCYLVEDPDDESDPYHAVIHRDTPENAAKQLVSQWDEYDSAYPIARSFGDQTLNVAVWAIADWHDYLTQCDRLNTEKGLLELPHDFKDWEVREIQAGIKKLEEAIAVLEQKKQVFTIGGEMVQAYYAVKPKAGVKP